MIAHLNDIAQIWWQWMGSMLWQVSLLIILVTILDMIIRRWAWPQVRYALWGLVFLKLIIPPTWQMPTSIVSRIQPQVEEQMSIQTGRLVWIEKNLEVPDSSELSQNKGEEPVIIKEPKTKTKVTWQAFVLLGWVAGMIIFSYLLVRKMSQFRKSQKLEGRTNIPEWFHDLMKKTANRLKLKKVPIIIFSKDVKSPAVYGLFRPVLLLSEGYLDQLSRKQAEHVLMHELCHLKRGDVWIHWFCIALQIIYWFNPLLIWSRRQMRYVCEICCDLSVANILREKTFKYRDTLLRSARELFPETMEPSLGLLGIFEEPFRLVPRLKWLEKKTWEKRQLKTAATICICLTMIICVLPMAGLSQPEAQSNTLMARSDSNPVESKGQQIPDESGVSQRMIRYSILLMEVDENKNLKIEIPPHGPPQDLTQVATSIKDIVINGETFEDLEELVSRMQAEHVNILSMPVLARNGETAKLKYGEVYTGELCLQITPEIIGDNNVQQDITVAVEKADEELNGAFREKSFETKLTVKEGNTFVIGGIPSRDVGMTSGNKRELCFFITPHIVNQEENMVDKDIRSFKTVPPEDVTVSIDFEEVDIMSFIKFISEITGKSFVVSNKVRGKVNVVGAEKVIVDEAYRVFESVLEVHGYTAVPSGNVIKIVENQPDAKTAALEPEEWPSTVVDQALRREQLQKIDRETAELKTMIDETNTRMKQHQAKVEDTPKREQELLSLNRDYESLKAIYNSLIERKLEAQIAISMEDKQVEGTSVEIDKKLGTLAFLDDELKDTEKRLMEKEEEIRDYRQKYMGGLPEQLQTNLAILEQLQSKIERLNANLRDLENLRADSLKDIAALTTPKEDGDTLTYLKKALSLLESRYAPGHPDIIRLKEMIANIEAEE